MQTGGKPLLCKTGNLSFFRIASKASKMCFAMFLIMFTLFLSGCQSNTAIQQDLPLPEPTVAEATAAVTKKVIEIPQESMEESKPKSIQQNPEAKDITLSPDSKLYIIESREQDRTLYGLMDEAGNIILKPSLDYLSLPNDIYSYENRDKSKFNWFLGGMLSEDGTGYKYAVIGSNGYILSDFEYDEIYFDGAERYYGRQGASMFIIYPDGKKSETLDRAVFKNGFKTVLTASGYFYQGESYRNVLGPYTKAWEFAENKAFVEDAGRIICIDSTGLPLFEMLEGCEPGGVFSGGICKIVRNGAYGIIDDKGKIIVEPINANIFVLSEGYSMIYGDVQKVMDKAGKEVLSLPKSDEIAMLGDVLAHYSGGNTTIIDKSGGKSVLNARIINILPNGYFIASKDTIAAAGGNVGIMDAAGKWVLEPKYLSLTFTGKYIIASRSSNYTEDKGTNGSLGSCILLDDKGARVLTNEYKNIIETDGKLVRVQTEKESGWVDMKGNWVYKITK